jgi:hypothetical protein
VVAVARRVRRSPASKALLLLALSLTACGGSDVGRPKPAATNVAAADAGDACTAADGLTFGNIMSFEPVAGSPPGLIQNATCDSDPALGLASSSSCTYFNFDNTQSARSCSALPPSPATCRQADGALVPDTFCTTVETVASHEISMGTPNLALSTIPGGRCGVSTSAFHLTGVNVAACYSPTTKKQGWGATIQITFNPSGANSGQSQKAFDASAWDGISFWQHRGSGPSGRAFLFSIQDPYSSNATLATNFTRPPECPNGVFRSDCFVQCSSMDGVPDAQKCDPFGLGVGLTDDWQLVKIPFDKAQQKGFGVPSPLGHLDSTALLGVQFALSAGDWDLWIDDIAFYREAVAP